MRLFEHEAKQLFAAVKIPVPKSALCHTPEECEAAARAFGAKVVVKAQVLTGGRGKAGGVRLAATPEEALEHGRAILALTIKGFPVRAVLVEEALDVRQELYLGVTLDRVRYGHAVLASAAGGVEIEETAARDPKAVVRLEKGHGAALRPFEALAMGKSIGLSGKTLATFGDIAVRLFDLYHARELKLVEINPLVITADGRLIAADARASSDPDALFRHPELTAFGVSDRHEEGEQTDLEKKAGALGIPYVDLEGDIGCFPGGAGFGIRAIDLITDLGGRPANFMDSGGGPTPERLSQMLGLLEDNPRVRAIFGARFGGVSRCDDFAKGVVAFLSTGRLTKPIAMRMTGNMWKEGLEIFETAKREHPEWFTRVEIFGIETPIEEVAARAIALGRSVGSAAASPRGAEAESHAASVSKSQTGRG